jgi:hypothetical protein
MSKISSATVHRAQCSCGWVGECWTINYVVASQAGVIHCEVENCGGEADVETRHPDAVAGRVTAV